MPANTGNLVLSRKEGECIIIGGNIEVYVVRIDGDRVKISIKCDKEIHIKRGELVGVDR